MNAAECAYRPSYGGVRNSIWPYLHRNLQTHGANLTRHVRIVAGHSWMGEMLNCHTGIRSGGPLFLGVGSVR